MKCYLSNLKINHTTKDKWTMIKKNLKKREEGKQKKINPRYQKHDNIGLFNKSNSKIKINANRFEKKSKTAKNQKSIKK